MKDGRFREFLIEREVVRPEIIPSTEQLAQDLIALCEKHGFVVLVVCAAWEDRGKARFRTVTMSPFETKGDEELSQAVDGLVTGWLKDSGVVGEPPTKE